MVKPSSPNRLQSHTDEQLAVIARDGDRDAYNALAYRWRDTLLRRLTGIEREDAVQEALLRGWKKLEDFDVSKTFGSWLTSIARNVVKDKIRKKRGKSKHGPRAHISFTEDLHGGVTHSTPFEHVLSEEAFRLIEGMHPREKKVAQGLVEGKSQTAIAKETGMSEPTVSRSRGRLQQALSQAMDL